MHRILSRLGAIPAISTIWWPSAGNIAGALILVSGLFFAIVGDQHEIPIALDDGLRGDNINGIWSGIFGHPISPLLAFILFLCSLSFGISIILLAICLPIYIWTSNEARVLKTGGLIKNAFGYSIFSMAGFVATLYFV